MEEEQNKKLGAGILAVSIIELVLETIALLGYVYSFVMKDKINSTLHQMGKSISVSPSTYIIGIIFAALIIISVILILLKNNIGVIGYFVVYIINIVYSIIKSGVGISILLSLILPVLMGIFIYQKKDIFFKH